MDSSLLHHRPQSSSSLDSTSVNIILKTTTTASSSSTSAATASSLASPAVVAKLVTRVQTQDPKTTPTPRGLNPKATSPLLLPATTLHKDKCRSGNSVENSQLQDPQHSHPIQIQIQPSQQVPGSYPFQSQQSEPSSQNHHRTGGSHALMMCPLCPSTSSSSELTTTRPPVDIRIAPCGHHFHRSCLEKWVLRVLNNLKSISSTQQQQALGVDVSNFTPSCPLCGCHIQFQYSIVVQTNTTNQQQPCAALTLIPTATTTATYPSSSLTQDKTTSGVTFPSTCQSTPFTTPTPAVATYFQQLKQHHQQQRSVKVKSTDSNNRNDHNTTSDHLTHMPPSFNSNPILGGTTLRRGKWTVEEEAYANALIHEFQMGELPLPEATTLRNFLSKFLNCDPMRISKKFVGAQCIGKQIYRRRTNHHLENSDGSSHHSRSYSNGDFLNVQLAELEQKFLERLVKQQKKRHKRKANELKFSPAATSTTRTSSGSSKSTTTAEHSPTLTKVQRKEIPTISSSGSNINVQETRLAAAGLAGGGMSSNALLDPPLPITVARHHHHHHHPGSGPQQTMVKPIPSNDSFSSILPRVESLEGLFGFPGVASFDNMMNTMAAAAALASSQPHTGHNTNTNNTTHHHDHRNTIRNSLTSLLPRVSSLEQLSTLAAAEADKQQQKANHTVVPHRHSSTARSSSTSSKLPRVPSLDQDLNSLNQQAAAAASTNQHHHQQQQSNPSRTGGISRPTSSLVNLSNLAPVVPSSSLSTNASHNTTSSSSSSSLSRENSVYMDYPGIGFTSSFNSLSSLVSGPLSSSTDHLSTLNTTNHGTSTTRTTVTTVTHPTKNQQYKPQPANHATSASSSLINRVSSMDDIMALVSGS